MSTLVGLFFYFCLFAPLLTLTAYFVISWGMNDKSECESVKVGDCILFYLFFGLFFPFGIALILGFGIRGLYIRFGYEFLDYNLGSPCDWFKRKE